MSAVTDTLVQSSIPGAKACISGGLTGVFCGSWAWLGTNHTELAGLVALIAAITSIYGLIEMIRSRKRLTEKKDK